MSEVQSQAHEIATRIRWHEDELELVATEMVRLELNKQGANELERVRMAQVVLPTPRQREIKTWSAMQARLGPHLERVRAKADSAPLLFSVEAQAQASASSALGSAAAVCAPLVATRLVAEVAAQVNQASLSGSDQVASQNTEPAQPAGADPEAACESAQTIVSEPLEGFEASSEAGQEATIDESLLQHSPSSAAAPESDAAVPVQEVAFESEKPTQPNDRLNSRPSARPSSQAIPQTGSLDPLMVEASLVAALQSPLVVQSLVDVFAQAMAKALSCLNVQVGQPPDAVASSARMRGGNIFPSRVLLAGFSTATAQALEQSLSGLCEVRIWRPNHGPQLFETLAKVCQVAVIPDEMEEGVDQDLRARNLVVIRHSGNINKLTERLEAVLS